MPNSLRVSVHESSQVGEARRAAMQLAFTLGAGEDWSSRVGIVATELARNLVLHAGGGDILLRALTTFECGGNNISHGLEILAIDKGKGMLNLAECLRDGFSTAGTPGTGLGAIQRLSDFFELHTKHNGGTVICCQFHSSPQAIPKRSGSIRIGGVSVPLTGEDANGDSWEVRQHGHLVRMLVADGLGHGPFAAVASREAVDTFNRCTESGLPDVLELMHSNLMKTRGAAASIVELDPATGNVLAAGIGNVVVRMFSADGASRQAAISNGTLGSSFRKPREMPFSWSPSDVIIMHSDGISTQWNFEDQPGLLQRHPSIIAAVLFRDFARVRDDATVVVLNSLP